MKEVILATVLLSAAVAAHAEDADTDTGKTALEDTTKAVKLENVIVNAPFRRIQYSYAALNTSHNRQQMFDLQPRTTPEALQGMTGVWVQQTNHGSGSPIIRGLIGYQTVMLVDGIRINNASFPGGPLPYLNTIDGMSISDIAVVPGASSVAYGSDAMGGVINIQTVSPMFTLSHGFSVHGAVTGRAATNGMEYVGRGEIDLANDVWAIHAGFDGKRFGDVHAGGGLGIERPSGYTEWAGDFKLRRRIGANSVLTAAYQGLRQYHIPTFLQIQNGKFDKYETKKQVRDLGYLSYRYTPQSEKLNYIESTVSYTRMAGTNWRIPKGSTVSTFADDDVRSLGLTADISLQPLPWANLKAGIDIYNDKVFSSGTRSDSSTGMSESVAGSYPDGSTMLTYAAFAEAEATLGKLKVGAGARYSGHRLSISSKDFGDVTLTPDAVVADMHISYELFRHFTAAWIMGSSFRAPNINDLAKLGAEDSWYFVPNFNLSPERGLNMEVSLKYDGRRTKASVNLYRNNLSNIMSLVPGQTSDDKTEVDGMPVRMKSNVDRAYVMGFEAAFEQQLCTVMWLTGNMTYTYGENTTGHQPLSKIPPLFGSVGLKYAAKRLSLALVSNMARRQDRLSPQDKEDARIPKGGTPGWAVLRLDGSYRLGHFMFAATFDNILDKGYRYHASGIDAPGRNAKMTVTYMF